MNHKPQCSDAGHFTAMRYDTAGAQRVRQATQQLEGWAHGWPEVNPQRIYATCLYFAEPAPWLSIEALVASSMWALWTFALDDLVDEGALTAQEFAPRFERYVGIARGIADVPDGSREDPLAALLHEVCEALSRSDVFTAARPYLARSLSDTLLAMLQEQEWRQNYVQYGTQPTYADYIENGLRSIGVIPCLWTMLIGTGDASALRHIDHLTVHMRHAAVCVRLANDMRSYRKELSEKNINSMTILAKDEERTGQTRATAVDAARQQVNRLVDQEFAICLANSHDTRTDTDCPEHGILNTARWAIEFYRHQGFLTCQPGTEFQDFGWTSDHS
ncbi:terpene synthase family protein [Streptomyces sp. NRRL S-646]|uniref:terpene synthase family protein n=1 Tax=Streptomyces sp. NRRL S-646 TaxID=1463917 RepID=UPI0004CAEC6D|nr:terpene synthase family protein [Streptomyces sp. NRRL S-646]